MWFKNLAVYKQTQPINIDGLATAFAQQPFKPCGAQDEFSVGFVAPIESADNLVMTIPGYALFCVKREEKVLPAGAINDQLLLRVKEIEDREMRKLPSKERSRIKDEIIFELLPRALTKSSKTYGYIDIDSGFVIIDAGSASKAEDILSLMRKCLGSLPVVPLATKQNIPGQMTMWLLYGEERPKWLSIGDGCELKSPESEGGIVRCKHHDLSLPEIKNHLDSGKQVTKLLAVYKDRLSFSIDQNLMIKSVKFLDLVQEKAADIEAFNEIEQFESDLTIMAAEVSDLLKSIDGYFNHEPLQHEKETHD